MRRATRPRATYSSLAQRDISPCSSELQATYVGNWVSQVPLQWLSIATHRMALLELLQSLPEWGFGYYFTSLYVQDLLVCKKEYT